MNKQVGNITPDLRFSEFKKVEGWKQEKLGNIFSERQETGYIDLPLLSLTDKDGIIPQENTNRKNNSSSDKSKYLRVYPEDIAYNTMRMWEGRSAYVTIEGLVSPAYTVCKPINDSNGLFFSYFFKTQQLIHQFHKYSQGLVKDTLNLKYEAFSQISIPVPKPNEQQKIADCLLSIDDLITVQTIKLDTLKAHKKGLMQQLFPVKGAAMPRLRFKEFREKGDWGRKQLGSVASFLKGKGISKSDISQNGIFPCIRYGELYTYYNETISTVKSYTNLASKDLILSQPNDVIIPSSGETHEDIATASCVLYGGIALGGDLNIIRSKINGVFLSYYLNNAKKNDIAQLAQGIAVVHLYSDQLKKLKINIPQPKEQQRIANCLSSLDELITIQSQRIETLKAHKKGLMQGLFPTVYDTKE